MRKRGILPMDRLYAAFSRHALFKNAWLILGFIDFYLRYAIKVYPSLVRGGIVLSDRYMYDVFAGRFQIVRNKLPKKTIFFITPSPDICFVVKRDPLAIASYRNDQDMASIDRYYKIMDGLKMDFFLEIINDEVNAAKQTCMAQIIRYFRTRAL